MLVPGTYPENYPDYLDYLQDFDDYLLIQEPFVPFWMRTIIDLMDLIGPETTPDLERICRLVLERPTYENLHRIRPRIAAQIADVRGPTRFRDSTPLERKYSVIENLLDGCIPDPFDDAEWSASFSCYAIGAIDPEDSHKHIIDARVKEALSAYDLEQDRPLFRIPPGVSPPR